MINFDKDEFIKNYNELKSSRKMADLYKCSKATILNYAKKINYDNNHNKIIKITNIPLEQIINDYETLNSLEKVGKKYGCSSTAVAQYLKTNNYKIESRLKYQMPNKEKFIELYYQLKSAKKMAEYIGCSSTTILNQAKLYDFDVSLVQEYKLTEQDKEKIIQQYYIKTSTELAQEYNVSRGMITKLWYDNGLKGKERDLSNIDKISMAGKQVNEWLVIKETTKRNSSGIIYWQCECQKCKAKRIISGQILRNKIDVPKCNCQRRISKGNEKIALLLTQANIPFEVEKTFPTCKDQNVLPFDFYVNNQYLIEYDGKQHYQKENTFYTDDIPRHDNIKSNWCKNNQIPLIRIPYTHFNYLNLNDLLLETSKFIEN